MSKLTIDEIKQGTLAQIDAQLEELRPAKESYDEWMAFRNETVGGPGRAIRSATSAPKPPATAARGRTGKKTRAEEFLDIVRDNPGITIPEAAKRMAMNSSNPLYRIKATLVDEGKIEMRESQVFPVDQDAAALAARTAELEKLAK